MPAHNMVSVSPYWCYLEFQRDFCSGCGTWSPALVYCRYFTVISRIHIERHLKDHGMDRELIFEKPVGICRHINDLYISRIQITPPLEVAGSGNKCPLNFHRCNLLSALILIFVCIIHIVFTVFLLHCDCWQFRSCLNEASIWSQMLSSYFQKRTSFSPFGAKYIEHHLISSRLCHITTCISRCFLPLRRVPTPTICWSGSLQNKTMWQVSRGPN